MNANRWVVIMAGGSGTRFWPVSRAGRPKQLTALLGSSTMIQATVGRLQGLVAPEKILVITTAAIAEATRAQLPMLPSENVIAEPEGRDTAPCVGLAAAIIANRDPDGVMALLPADQLIEPVADFHKALNAGFDVAENNRCLVTYGIEPRFPATGYGYIHLGNALADSDGLAVNQVAQFVENQMKKPQKGILLPVITVGTAGCLPGVPMLCLKLCARIVQNLLPQSNHLGPPLVVTVSLGSSPSGIRP